MPSGEYDVGALAGQRQLVLDDHLDPGEPRVGQVVSEPGEAARPGHPLAGADARATHPDVFVNPVDQGPILGQP